MTRVLSLRTYDLRLNSVALVTSFEPGLPPIIADASQIQQALLNLILNAEQAMREREGRILTVSARFDETASAVNLSVGDTGHGIDEINLTRIFDPFFTTRDVGDGTGLGLSICYGIVRDHGGQIHVESRVNVGTTFSILLPARPHEPARPADPVLVAHPDQGDLDYMVAALVAWGYTVASTQDAEEAIARYLAGGLQAALIDRGLIAADLAGWWAAVDSRSAPYTARAAVANVRRERDRPVRTRAGERHPGATLPAAGASFGDPRGDQGVRMTGQPPLLLVVDDEPGILEIVGRFARRAGFDVVACSGGQAAIEQMQARGADLVMVDLRMPDVGGLDVLRAIRETDPQCQAVLMTGYGSLDTAVEAIKLGALDYLTKPLDFRRLELLLGGVREETRAPAQPPVDGGGCCTAAGVRRHDRARAGRCRSCSGRSGGWRRTFARR